MANFTAGTSFSDGVTNDVTAAKLNALVADAVPTSNLSLTSTNGTIANFTTSTANITLGTIPTLTAGTTTGTAGIFTSGTIPTLTTGTTTGTAGIFTSGTITTGTIGTLVATGTITGSTNVVNIGSGQIYKDASGNVGIGTASPAGKLDVNGCLRTTGQTIPASGVGAEMVYASNAAGFYGYDRTNGTYTNTIIDGLNLTLRSGGGDSLTVKSGGNVGIGITSPATKLHVDSGSSTLPLIQISANAANSSYFGGANSLFTGGGTTDLGIFSNNKIMLGGAGDPTTTITGGSVGIGTTSPSAKLQVASGDIVISDNFGIGAGSGAQGIYNGTSQFVRFDTASAERLRIASAGQIGIGGANYGTSGQALVSNGASAAPSWQSVSAITSGTAVTSTSGTAIDFTGIPSGVKRVTLMFRDVSTTGVNSILVQIGTSSGIVSTGYAGVGSLCANGNTPAVGASTTGFLIFNDQAADLKTGHMIITLAGSNIYISSHTFGGDSTRDTVCWGGSSVNLGGVMDRIRITTNSANTFDSGLMNILYES